MSYSFLKANVLGDLRIYEFEMNYQRSIAGNLS